MVMIEINTWVGIALSLFGSLTVAPGALSELGRLARHDAHQVRGQLARFIPWLRRNATVHAGVATGWATMSGVATATATGKVTHSGPTEEQLGQLWSELERVDQDLGRLRTDMSEKESALRASITEVQTDVQTKHGEVVRRFEEAEKKETKINAIALPLIGFGILLSSAATDIARLPVWANILVLIVFIGVSVRVSWPIVSDLKRGSSEGSA